MKYLRLLFFQFSLLYSSLAWAQLPDFYGKYADPNICTQLNITQDEKILNLVTRILEVYNLDNTYVIQACSSVENCVAAQRNGVQYILYNPDYMDDIRTLSFTESDMPVSQGQWNHLMVLAHEVGHHMNNHLTNPLGLKPREMELKADETAGFILYQLGAPDPETACSALRSPGVSEAGSASHPPREERIAAFRKGWDKAAAKDNKNSGTQTGPKPDSERFYIDSLVGKMILVRGGTFKMGCTREQKACDDDEMPAHQVTLDDYYIGETEVTMGQYRYFALETGHVSTGKSVVLKGSDLKAKSGVDWRCDETGEKRPYHSASYPVLHVSWFDATAYTEWLSRKTGISYRLPTEAEWEYAARGGQRGKGFQYAGGNNLEELAWYGENSNNKPHIVKSRASNELGLFDMSGNVCEWCADYMGAYSEENQSNPAGADTGELRVVRGGSWGNTDNLCRVACRTGVRPDNRDFNLGFRVVSQAKNK